MLVMEPHARRGEWPLGRISETYHGPDGLVRVARVLIEERECLRLVNRLCPLEYMDQD